MSKIGPRPLLDTLIRLDDGCYELGRIYIYIQFGQIPMTAVAVQQYRPAMDSCMNGMRLYRTGAGILRQKRNYKFSIANVLVL